MELGHDGKEYAWIVDKWGRLEQHLRLWHCGEDFIFFSLELFVGLGVC